MVAEIWASVISLFVDQLVASWTSNLIEYVLCEITALDFGNICFTTFM